MEQGKILALDYGQRHIGLAVSDISRQFVFGRGTLTITPSEGMKPVFQKIAALCAHENIQELLIGLPLDEEGNETPQTAKIRSFANRLSSHLPGCRISFGDESFSSFEADRMLSENPLPPAKKKELQHEFAAMVILKKFLKIS